MRLNISETQQQNLTSQPKLGFVPQPNLLALTDLNPNTSTIVQLMEKSYDYDFLLIGVCGDDGNLAGI